MIITIMDFDQFDPLSYRFGLIYGSRVVADTLLMVSDTLLMSRSMIRYEFFYII